MLLPAGDSCGDWLLVLDAAQLLGRIEIDGNFTANPVKPCCGDGCFVVVVSGDVQEGSCSGDNATAAIRIQMQNASSA